VRYLTCFINQLHTKVGKQYFQIEDTERRLVKQITKEGIPWTTIQKITGRSPDTISTIVRQRILVKAVL
jgi:IS30 family transposase